MKLPIKLLRKKLHYIKKQPKLIRIIVAILTLSILLVAWLGISHNNNDKPKKKIVYSESREAKQDTTDGLINIPKDAKSEVCEAIPSNTIEKIIQQKTQGAKVSIPTTKTREGVVSACAYSVVNIDKSPISSIIITRRKFNNPSDAQKNFSILSKIPDDNRQFIDKSKYFNTKTGQVVVVKDSTLTVFAINKTASGTIDESIYRKLAKL